MASSLSPPSPYSHRQSPLRFILLVALVSLGLETPRFFMFELVRLNETRVDFWTTDLMEDPAYIQFSSYWDELLTKGAVPLLALVYFNAHMIVRIRRSARALAQSRHVGGASVRNAAAARPLVKRRDTEVKTLP